MPRFKVRPVTSENRDDHARLFEARGSPHYCWCTSYRFRDAQAMTSARKKNAVARLIADGTPIGVLAYDGDEPVGWCSVAPRETYVKLERSRTMPRVTPPEAPTWTVLCFFVVRSHRGEGVASALIDGAVKYAKASGAAVIEAYPFDSAKVSSTHRGHSSVFAGAGFQRDGARWSLELGRRKKRKASD